MSKTLNLVDHLLRQARNLQTLGFASQARELLERLERFRELPQDAAEEIQVRLGELCHSADDLPQARQHQTVALAHQPKSAEYHFHLAQMEEDDEAVSPEAALKHYAQAVNLDPDNSLYLVHYGMLAVRLGYDNLGLELLRKAHLESPADLDILDKVTGCLFEADLETEARDLLRTAMFRNSGDRRFVDLYRKHQFRTLHQDQVRMASIPFPADEPVILPFAQVKKMPKRFTIDGQIFRLDGAEPLQGPGRKSRKPMKKKQR